jgi:hypothetical protein
MSKKEIREKIYKKRENYFLYGHDEVTDFSQDSFYSDKPFEGLSVTAALIESIKLFHEAKELVLEDDPETIIETGYNYLKIFFEKIDLSSAVTTEDVDGKFKFNPACCWVKRLVPIWDNEEDNYVE